ncbi:MAG: type I DNA topoisomerase [Candidatus Hydrogenedentes bacterium]|nr:type I DNA topoisomerase [Candidatus Hydrogenedentota bacterium]
MSKILVVVESPAKAKTINKFLGPNYIVRASYGHVRDLPKSDLGVDVNNNFQPKYVTLKDSAKAVKALQEAAKTVDSILLASDPDREGEAIGWHVATLLEKSKKPVQRIVFNEITKRSVKAATKHPREIDLNLVNAQQARRVLDRLVGYKISPFLQWAVKKGLSAGRVQSVAVRMVCEREDEIRAFIIEEYWTIEALLETIRGDVFTARLVRVAGEKPQLPNEDSVKQVLARLDGAKYSIANIETKEVRRRPYPPFITSSLQQEASRKLGFSPRKTMILAQQLYEGIALGAEGTDGLITYMRTDSTRIANEALDEVRAFIRENHVPKMLPEKPNFYASKKGAQDAHEGIRPTVPARTPEKVGAFLDDDQLKLYTLIWRRFVASQMTPAVLDQTIIDITAADCAFRASGSVMKFQGFTVLYEETVEDKQTSKDTEEDPSGLLPQVNAGESVASRELKPEQHFTKPPPRYSEASLIRALEENGIGRPSTYAPTINTITERGYVEREKGRLKPTELGEQVNTLLVANFPEILEIGFTAQLESDLDHVEEGTREWHDLIKDFYTEFDKVLTTAQKKMITELVGEEPACPKCGSRMELRHGFYGMYLACTQAECDGRISVKKKASAEPTDIVCDLCGSPMVLRIGRFGKFLACSTYPACKNTHKVDKEGNRVDTGPKEPPKKTDQKCPTCGGFLLIRKSRRGEEFYGCEKYPKCKFTKPMELGIACPQCSVGNLVSKMARGRRFYGCDRYPECDYKFFGQIDKTVPCGKCGNSWTVITKGKNKPTMRTCPKPNCGFEEELPPDEV